MFDLGMMELLVIGVTALIVVGPKDLPVMFRNVGRFMGRMRGMARDFQRAMNDAADETGMRGLDRDIRKMTSAGRLGLGDVKDAARAFADDPPPAKGTEGDAAKPAPKPRGAETARLAEERAQASARVREAAAERAAARAAPEVQEPAQAAEAPEAKAS